MTVRPVRFGELVQETAPEVRRVVTLTAMPDPAGAIPAKAVAIPQTAHARRTRS